MVRRNPAVPSPFFHENPRGRRVPIISCHQGHPIRSGVGDSTILEKQKTHTPRKILQMSPISPSPTLHHSHIPDLHSAFSRSQKIISGRRGPQGVCVYRAEGTPPNIPVSSYNSYNQNFKPQIGGRLSLEPTTSSTTQAI